MDTKYCRKCEEDKPLSGFHRDRKRKDGLQVYCKECQYRGSGTRRELYARREELAKQGLRDCTGCRENKPFSEFHKARSHDGMTSLCKQCQKKRMDPVVARDRNLRRLYGITLADYNAMLEAQGGVCAGCLRDPSVSKNGVLCVDHNHGCCSGDKTCGKCVRGLLCSDCNTSLGKLLDSPETLRRLADYLTAGGLVSASLDPPRLL